ncbi:MAG: ErmE/ErmH/ErmO/ErmR family 23S rRNA (adenine(2058)-N(6))-methyltransferase [Streptosporangiaceae bacterium]
MSSPRPERDRPARGDHRHRDHRDGDRDHRDRDGDRDHRDRDERDRRRRELSQNYLRSPEAAARFLREVDSDPGGLCLEVGAGEGILTRRLATMFGEVTAYEIDPAGASRLSAATSGLANVRVVMGDFLAAHPPRQPFQVAGNAPFSLTSPIVDWCLHARTMTSATLITQLEYARKRTGGYGRWSLLTVSTWPQVRWELRATIGREQFRPVPRVDAGILRIDRRPQPLIPAARMATYQRLVRAGFSGVGGSLLASLRREYPPERLRAAFQAAGVDRAAVVAFVSPAQWVELFRILDRGN